MKPFRLAGLARLRKLQEKQAAAELAQRSAERRRAEERRELADRQLGDSGLPRQGESDDWQYAVAVRAAASAALNDAQAADAVARGEESQAHGRWATAKTRITTLDKLAQRHVIAEKAEDLRLEQRTLDEIASQRSSGAPSEER